MSAASRREERALPDAATCRFFVEIGFTTGDMAAALGLAPFSVRNRARKFGIKFPNKPSLARRFHKSYEVQPSGCWRWTAADRGNGYGCIMDGGRLVSAHRVSVELFHGAIPEGKIICHRCDNPWCVNPSHLFIGSHADNATDMRKKGRGRAAQGINHHAAKLSEADVTAIRESAEKGVDLARQHGVCGSAISKIRNGRARVYG